MRANKCNILHIKNHNRSVQQINKCIPLTAYKNKQIIYYSKSAIYLKFYYGHTFQSKDLELHYAAQVQIDKYFFFLKK